MAAGTIHEVRQTIELVCSEYGERQIKKLVNGTGLPTEEIHELRGKAQACRDLLNALKTAITE